jgi:hypothetical protein
LPTAASANAGSEAVSAKPIVIAYIPEHVQQRVPGHQHQHKPQATYSTDEVLSEKEGLD